jgi:hypothetical protein
MFKQCLVGAANQLRIFPGDFIVTSGTLLKICKMGRALNFSGYTRVVMGEFDAAEKIYQTGFAFITSFHCCYHTTVTL